MSIDCDFKQMVGAEYCGYILRDNYSSELKKQVAGYIDHYRNFGKTDNPAISYISAWKEGEDAIWYEFISDRFVGLLGCECSEAAEVFRNSVIDYRIYRYLDFDLGIKEEIISHREVEDFRKVLRKEAKKSGVIDAVYKISVQNGRDIWVKDQATIKTYSEDKIYLSLGCLVIVTKEMEAEDELKKHHDHLEEIVLGRTAELEKTNRQLELEIDYRKKIEAHLKESEESYHRLLSSMDQGFGIVDENLDLTFANNKLCEMWGYRQDEIIGCSVTRYLDEKNRKILIKQFKKRNKSDFTAYEIQWIRKSGQKIETLVAPKPIYDKNGRFKGTFSVLTDITELKATQEALRKSEERFNLALEAANDAVWDWNIRTGKIYASSNYYKMIGYEPFEISLSYSAWAGLLHPDDRQAALDKINESTKENGKEHESEFRLQTKSGQWRWILGRGKVIERDSGGNPTRMIGTHIDITDRKQAEQLLGVRERQQKAVAEFSQKALKNENLLVLFDIAALCVSQTLDTEYSKVLKLLPKKNVFLFQSGVGWNEGVVGRTTVENSIHTQAGYTLLSNEPLIMEDLRSETRFSGPYLLWEHGVISGVSVIIGEQSKPFGVLGAHTTQKRIFTKDDINFLLAIANILASTIEREKTRDALQKAYDELEQEVRKRTSELLRTNQQLKMEIEERKRAEDALVESEQRLSQIINFLPDPTFAIDLKGRVIAWNLAMENMTGVMAKGILGKGNYEYALPFYGRRKPILIDLMLNPDEKIEKEYHILRREKDVLITEVNFPKLKGRDAFVWGKASPIYDYNGNVVGAIEAIRDITERKQTEEFLLQTEEKTRAILNATTDLVLLIEKNGIINALNDTAAHRLGKDMDELIGVNIYDILPADLSRQRKARCDEVFCLGRPVLFEDELHEKRFLNSVYPIFDGQGNIVQLAIYSRDVTQTKLLQDQLIRSERLVATGQLAASIAHEINSPLQAITVMLSILKEKFKTDADLLSDIDLLKGAFTSIRDTVKNLLDLNRPGKEEKQLVNINHIIEKTVKLVRAYLKKKQVRVNLDLSPAVPNIFASPQQLSHVFLNLVNNASEAMSRTANVEPGVEKRLSSGGEITIKTHFVNENIIINVFDTGPGISKEDLNHIFDPFYTKKKRMGMGIGLSVCHGIIEEHNGTITAGDSPGGGTIFNITLPANHDR